MKNKSFEVSIATLNSGELIFVEILLPKSTVTGAGISSEVILFPEEFLLIR